jgi:hypothetical protein
LVLGVSIYRKTPEVICNQNSRLSTKANKKTFRKEVVNGAKAAKKQEMRKAS